MRNGTQAELDAAREDATKLPFDAKFILKICETRDKGFASVLGFKDGDEVWRLDKIMSDAESISIQNSSKEGVYYVSTYELEVIHD